MFFDANQVGTQSTDQQIFWNIFIVIYLNKYL